MKLTNEKNLPDVFIRAIENNEQPPSGLSDVIRVSELIAPPQIVQLNRKHYKDIEEDASSKLWQLNGTLMHTLLEQASEGTDAIIEETIRVQFEHMTVTGTPDIISGNVLSDYKNTSVFAIKSMIQDGKVKEDWFLQVQIYRYLFECPMPVKEPKIDTLQIIAIARDWRQGEYDRAKPEDCYPERVTVFDVPVLPLQEIEQDIIKRIELHYNERNAIKHYDCTDEERWTTPIVYAVKKAGNKRAIKLHDNLEDARKHHKELSDKADGKKGEAYLIEERPARFNRCEGYCNVAPFCEQFKSSQKTEV